MEIKKQISIFLKNKPGTLAKVTESFAEKGVNILGFTIVDSIDHAVARMVVSDPAKAVHLLGDAGMLVVESEVVAIKLDNRPGRLMEISRALAKARINIDYAYGSTPGPRGKGVIFLKLSNHKKAAAVLDQF